MGENETNKKAAPNTDEIAQYIWGIKLEEDFKYFNIYADVQTLMDKTIGFAYHPTSINYITGISTDFKNITISLEHQCWHPIDSESTINEDVETYNQVMIRYKF